MLFFIGIILGLLNLIDFGTFGLGEFFLIIILFFSNFMKKGNNKKNYIIYLKNNFNSELFKIGLFIIFLIGYFFWTNISKSFVIKDVVKWLTIFTEMFLINKSLNNNKKIIDLLISFMLFSKLSEYHTFNTIYSLHYFFIIPIFNLLYIKNKSNNYKYLLYLICLIYFFIGKSRSALILLMIYIAYEWANFVLINLISKKFNNKIKALGVIFLFIVGSIFSIQYIKSNTSLSTESNNERRILIQIVFEEFKTHPILGVGPINFNNYAQNTLGYRLRNNQLTPHNLYLEILSENGIIGFMLFLNILSILFRIIKKQNLDFSVKFSALYILVYYMFSTFTGTNRIVFTILFAVVSYEYYRMIGAEHYEQNISDCTYI